jgi:hypothetical protein
MPPASAMLFPKGPSPPTPPRQAFWKSCRSCRVSTIVVLASLVQVAPPSSEHQIALNPSA